MAEAKDLKSFQCGFESHSPYQLESSLKKLPRKPLTYTTPYGILCHLSEGELFCIPKKIMMFRTSLSL